MEEDMVELASFAVLPRIMTCGHEMLYDDLYSKVGSRNFDKSDIPSVTSAIHSHLNCLGLTCDDIGKHTAGNDISWYPDCSDNLDIAGYVPTKPKSTNMVSLWTLLDLSFHLTKHHSHTTKPFFLPRRLQSLILMLLLLTR